jgi:uncharacterized protein
MKLGGMASGEDFFDRKTECAALWRYLEKDHVVASGPRRLGKSSIVNRLREKATAKGFLAAHVDVQGIEGAQAFVDELARHFPDASIKGYWSSMGTTVKSWLPAIKNVNATLPGGAAVAVELQMSASHIWYKSAAAIQARLAPAPVLIFIDEFSVFLKKLLDSNRSEAEALLAWLRAWRVTPGVACRFLFTGSVGLHSLLERYGLSAQINDCFEYPIGPFKASSAQAMLAYFAQRKMCRIDTAIAAQICEKIGWLSPYLLCLMLDQTIQAASDRADETLDTLESIEPSSKVLTEQDLDNAYERLVARRSRFVHWEERLQRDLSAADLAFAKLVLTAVANNLDGLSKAKLLSRLAKIEPDPDQRPIRLQNTLNRLQDEGYLSVPDATGNVRFLSFLLRDYWKRNHG